MRPLPIEDKGGVLLVKVVDNEGLNEGSAELRRGLYAALAASSAPRIVLDLGDIAFISSTGIALLIGTKRRVDLARGRLVLCGLHSDILDLFGLMKLTALFEIVDDEATAIALLGPPAVV